MLSNAFCLPACAGVSSKALVFSVGGLSCWKRLESSENGAVNPLP